MFVVEICLLMAWFLATFLVVDSIVPEMAFQERPARGMRVLRSVRQDWVAAFVPRESWAS